MTAFSRPLAFTIALGILGGAALIATVVLSRRGPMIFLPYAAIVLAGAFYLRLDHVRPFTLRLIVSTGSFMIATLIVYVFIVGFEAHSARHISVIGHAWRLGLMLLIGVVLASVVAYLTSSDGMRSPTQRSIARS
jgi:hypothetical protein